MVKLNLNGRTMEEIMQISSEIKYMFALFDELNKMPGIIQNQLLCFLDGYVELRGKNSKKQSKHI